MGDIQEGGYIYPTEGVYKDVELIDRSSIHPSVFPHLVDFSEGEKKMEKDISMREKLFEKMDTDYCAELSDKEKDEMTEIFETIAQATIRVKAISSKRVATGLYRSASICDQFADIEDYLSHALSEIRFMCDDAPYYVSGGQKRFAHPRARRNREERF